MIRPWALSWMGSRVIRSSGSDRGSAVLKGQGKEAPGVGVRTNWWEKEERRRALSYITY